MKTKQATALRFLVVLLFSITGFFIQAKPIRVLIVGGGASHDFDRWYKQTDAATLRQNGLCAVTYTDNTDSIATYLPATDVLFLSNNQPIPNPAVRQAILRFVEAGKGLILAHAAVWYNWADWPEYNLQLVSGGSDGHDPYGPFIVEVNGKQHPVMKGIPSEWPIKDERYHYVPDPKGPGIEILASNRVAGADTIYPTVFVVKNPKARIVGITLGHDAEAHTKPAYQTLLRNAVSWVAHRK